MNEKQNIKNSDIQLCKKYSDSPKKIESILTGKFHWWITRIESASNKWGSFYKYAIKIKYKGKSLSFEFSDSIQNRIDGKMTPCLYDILCSIRSDYYLAQDYPCIDDFAGAFYDKSSIKISEVLKTHSQLLKFAKDIGRVFSEDELDCFPS